MSRTIKFAKVGGPDVLEFIETTVPAPGPAEVRIKVKAIGINRAESMWRQDDSVSSMPWAGTSLASRSAMRSTSSRPSR